MNLVVEKRMKLGVPSSGTLRGKGLMCNRQTYTEDFNGIQFRTWSPPTRRRGP
ncbi:hypothetical protein AVEN_47546-1 [Araneus ventricosus]|uniref:Uncharacterized protein n=1 Tax=Araneus ventricosus TaxID=182803 RepID=A0A4Y2E2Z1_ARAVE|nr:hypothetical protein AVEN_47546-1 [Araneus ventricosus]